MLDELISVVFTKLGLDCPVLTGNMKTHIYYGDKSEKKCQIIVSGPSFDQQEYEETGRFVYDGKYDYAVSVNAVGAFGGRSTKSKHWVNKSLVRACQIIGLKYNAEVIVNVEQ